MHASAPSRWLYATANGFYFFSSRAGWIEYRTEREEEEEEEEEREKKSLCINPLNPSVMAPDQAVQSTWDPLAADNLLTAEQCSDEPRKWLLHLTNCQRLDYPARSDAGFRMCTVIPLSRWHTCWDLRSVNTACVKQLCSPTQPCWSTPPPLLRGRRRWSLYPLCPCVLSAQAQQTGDRMFQMSLLTNIIIISFFIYIIYFCAQGWKPISIV